MFRVERFVSTNILLESRCPNPMTLDSKLGLGGDFSRAGPYVEAYRRSEFLRGDLGDFKTITCGQAIDAPAHSRILVDSRRS